MIQSERKKVNNSRFLKSDYFFSWSQESRMRRQMKEAPDAVCTSCSGQPGRSAMNSSQSCCRHTRLFCMKLSLCHQKHTSQTREGSLCRLKTNATMWVISLQGRRMLCWSLLLGYFQNFHCSWSNRFVCMRCILATPWLAPVNCTLGAD